MSGAAKYLGGDDVLEEKNSRHFAIFQDWVANKGNVKGQVVLAAFRFASLFNWLPSPFRYIGYPYVALYRLFVEWFLGIELPWKLKVGPGLRIFHGQALVVNDRALIGANCILRHSTTIGVSETSEDFSGNAPIIEDLVDVGSNVVIVGGVRIGRGAMIGAGSVVVNDVPERAVVVGNPARVVRILVA